MQNRYDAGAAPDDLLELRAYTSRLLGQEPALVLHGGGNTSLKLTARDFFGDPVETLYVKGSGWDLETIAPAGFSPVRMEVLLRMAALPSLSDTAMVREQRAALLDPSAPNPSLEAILHALIPLRFVDHTHADAVVALSNSPGGEAKIRALYGEEVLVVPYIKPGFDLAQAVYRMTRELDEAAWGRLSGLILMAHGVFTFGHTAEESYGRMIELVGRAEELLEREGALAAPAIAEEEAEPTRAALLELAELRGAASRAAGRALIARWDRSREAVGFASREDVGAIGTRGPLTPDHVIRARRVPALVEGDPAAAIQAYGEAYEAYFREGEEASQGSRLTALDPAPRWAIWRGRGVVAFGPHDAQARQVKDIVRHTARAIQWAEALGGWQPLPASEIFQMEYWELEQRKLRSAGAPPPLEGRIALVTGGAVGIGRATVQALRAQGAAVCALDLREEVSALEGDGLLGIVGDATSSEAVEAAVEACVARFGGLDLLVANAGDFPISQGLDAIEDEAWSRSLALNLGAHMKALRAAVPYLERGSGPAVTFIASRNALAPGPGVAAYSVAKAGMTQLARVAALELAPKGVRVNVLHPDKVFDTELWSAEKLEARARHYGIEVDAYRKRNLLGVEVHARDVAALVCALSGPLFAKTTGAQISVDGGDPRAI